MSDEGDENWDQYLEESDGQQDDQSDGQIELENLFYEAEELKDKDPKAAQEQYMLLLDSEEPLAEKTWSAKCIGEIIGIKVRRNDLEDMPEVVKKLLAYINNMSKYDRGVTIDCIFNAVNRIPRLDKKRVTFETLLEFLREKDMGVFWLSTSLRLARIYLSAKEIPKFEAIISQMEKSKDLASIEEIKTNAKLLTIYCELNAMKVELYLERRDLSNLTKLMQFFAKIKLQQLASSENRVLSVLMEAEGVIAILEKNWEEADEFVRKAFQQYHELGHEKTKEMLLLCTATSILTGAAINPFGSPEAQMFLQDDSVSAYSTLWTTFSDKNHREYLDVLEKDCSSELFKRLDLVGDLRKAVLYGYLEKIVPSYKNLGVAYLSRELRIPEQMVLQILVEMIIDGRIHGRIDEVAKLLVVNKEKCQTSRAVVCKYCSSHGDTGAHAAAEAAKSELDLVSDAATLALETVGRNLYHTRPPAGL